MLLDASFDGPVKADYFALHRAFERPAVIHPAPDPAMTAAWQVPPWAHDVERRLAWILSLPKNWDGFSAAPVARETVRRALAFLGVVMPLDAPAPDIGPTKDGHVQFEWHRATGDLEIKMRPNGEFVVSFDDLDAPERSWEDTVTVDLQRTRDAIREICGRP
jgi:hypothetical protein